MYVGRKCIVTRNHRGFETGTDLYQPVRVYLTRPMKFVHFIKFFVARSSRECYENREIERERERERREGQAGGWTSISESKIFTSYAGRTNPATVFER